MMAVETQMPAMRLSALLPELVSCPEVSVTGLCLDSRAVQPGDVFIAIAGTRFDGRQFVAQAIKSGAAAVLVDAQGWQGAAAQGAVPVIAVDALGEKTGLIASRFYGEPSQALRVTAVTGTNGKTTVTHLAARVAGQLEDSAAVIGTLGWGCINRLQPVTHTTPDAIVVQRQLATLRDDHVQSVFMEVSSHALDQARVAGVLFETAVFTNLSHDHLDYHGTMEAYEQAKARLFRWPGLRHAVINADDVAGRRLLASAHAGVQHLSYSVDDVSADIHAIQVDYLPTGIRAKVHTPWGEAAFQCRLLGEFNLSNVLAVIAVLGLQGHALERICAALETVSPVTGRLESVAIHHGISIVIDYAHTPDALEKMLRTLRQHTKASLRVVFGCGGDRDSAKRPVMGRLAGQLADQVYLTSDNPRHESSQAILQAILSGMVSPQSAEVVEDRATAIRMALDAAVAGDTVVIAGKGHETWQQVGDEKRPFSDHAVVHAWLASRQGKGGHA